ncbi:MAG: peptidase M28, partial [Gemmatimonadaceae bacterium]
MACAPNADRPAADSSALATITSDDLMRHTQRLSSDAFEGRAPGTPGEDSTVAYLTSEFQRLGLAPGNLDGSFVQTVEMVGFTAAPSAAISARGSA